MNKIREFFAKINKLDRKIAASAQLFPFWYLFWATVGILVFVWFIANMFFPLREIQIKDVEVRVKKGMGLKTVAQLLHDKGVIPNTYLFIGYVELVAKADQLKAGKYMFPKANIPTIANMIIRGQYVPDDIGVVIFEGFNIWQIDQALADAALINEGDFTRTYINDEGYVFPDTYHIRNINTDNEEKMTSIDLREFRIKTSDNYDSKVNELLAGLSPQKQKEAIIIASILEKEVYSFSDMKLVAGIIQKRIALKMPLQIDATVMYGACLRKARESGFLKNCDVSQIGVRKEISIDSSYNTYRRKGLPPGPISNPGLQAIKAALNPTTSKYLYYLSTRDGRTIYSKTGAEHEANRARYILN